ncbi:MAG TPA: hypothetical protein VFB50_04240 [Chloroflexota bacterium]|nr:hypothetical protein [Chloroflexota bacterium]
MAAFDTLLRVFRPVADAAPEAARLWPPELGLAPGLLAETLPDTALARLPTDTAAELRLSVATLPLPPPVWTWLD